MRVVGTVESAKRLQNSANGNPRYEFVIVSDTGNRRKLQTDKDSQCGYLTVEIGSQVVCLLTDKGTVSSIHPSI